MDNLADHTKDTPKLEAGALAPPQIPTLSKEQPRPEWQAVLCIASRSPLDEAAAAMLAQLLEKHGLSTRVQPFADVASAKAFKVDAPDARLVCLSYFRVVGNPAHVRFLIRRLKRLMPNAKFLAGYWMLGEDPEKGEDWKTAVGAHFVATSLTDAVAICVREARAPDRDFCASESQAEPAMLPSKQLKQSSEKCPR